MIELRFRLDLYAKHAVDTAVEAFSPFAQIEREPSPEAEVVRLRAHADHDEAALAGELANYVLGATVDGAVAPPKETP